MGSSILDQLQTDEEGFAPISAIHVLPVKPRLYWETVMHLPWEAATLQTVALSEVQAWGQETIEPARVSEYMRRHSMRTRYADKPFGWRDRPYPLFVKDPADGLLTVIDGHHRTAAALLLGVERIRVRVMDLTEVLKKGGR